ncbi:MAG: glycosyltransferase family 4 protein, partial [Chloroflexota bacterium]
SVKYQYYLKALTRHFHVAGVFDTSLRGIPRLMNALQVARPNMQYWKQRLYMNVPAFRLCSRRAANYVRTLREPVDVILQDGVLFDAHWEALDIPSVIYTDYTARLSARQPVAGRSPFTPREFEEWVWLETQAMQRAAHILTWSDFVRRSVIRDYNIPSERVTAVGGGVNFTRLPEVAPRPRRMPSTALFIGADLHRKGGDLVLQAFERLRRRVPAARLVLITASPIPAGLSLEGVTLHSPIWDRDAISDLYQQADLFVLPSRLETWGDVILEAMAYELPCIGVAGQPMEEIIVHEKTGLLVPPEDIEALAAAMLRLFENPKLCRAWGRAGRTRLEDQYTWKQVVNRMAPVIRTASVKHNSLPYTICVD